jgi:hypothetical protein
MRRSSRTRCTSRGCSRSIRIPHALEAEPDRG